MIGATHVKAIKVPTTPRKKIYVKYLKNCLFFKLYPAPKIIKCKTNAKNILSLNAKDVVKSKEGMKNLNVNVIAIPRSITTPDS